MQTLDLPALRVTGIVDEIWGIARKASRGATRKLPEFVVARQLRPSQVQVFAVEPAMRDSGCTIALELKHSPPDALEPASRALSVARVTP